MSNYEETSTQNLIVDESLQLFRQQERIFQYTSVESQDYQPVIKNANKGQIVFEITPSQFHFTLPEFVLNVTWKLTQADGSAIPIMPETCAVIDLIHYSMFKTCRFRINDYWALNVQDYYPMLQYVTDRLTYSKVANETWRQDLLGVAIDTQGYNDTASAGKNLGWRKRADLVSGSRLVTTKGRINAPCFQSGKAFLPGTKFSLVLEHRWV